MVKAARKLIQTAVIQHIKKQYQVTNQEIADSIGVHMSHIQKASKGVRLLSDRKLNQLCEQWDIDFKDFLKRLELDDEEYLRRKTLIMLLQNEDIPALSEKTGISPLDLYQMQREKLDPTAEQVEQIAKALEIDSKIIREGLVAIVFEFIDKGLDLIHVNPEAIKALKAFLMKEI